MRVSRNSKKIKLRAKLGTYATFAGLGVLVIGMVISFSQTRNPTLPWLPLVALLIGFGLSQIGSYNLRRWARNPRPDQVIERELKGMDDRYHLYSWALPAPHVLLSPQGIYTFETRDQTGQITVTGSKWHTKMSAGRLLLLFGQEGLGNPTADAQERAAKVAKLIQTELPDVQAKVQPIVVFINQRAQLSVDEPEIPVLDAPSLKKWLRGAGKGDMLKTADYRAIEKVLDEKAGDVTTSEEPEEPKRQRTRARR